VDTEGHRDQKPSHSSFRVSLCYLTAGNYDQLRLFDKDKGTEEVGLWTSVQGLADMECHVTSDVDLVLCIAKYFGETGKPLPEANWEG
jgi:hypothetical protein